MKSDSNRLLSYFLRHQVLQVLFVIILYFSIEPYLSLGCHQFLYSVSITIKDLLKIFIPLAITVFIASTVASYGKSAPLFIVLIIIFEAISNATSVYYAYGSAIIAHNFIPDINDSQFNPSLHLLWTFPFSMPKWWAVDKGAFLGLLLGLLQGFLKNEKISNVLLFARDKVEFILSKIFARIIAIFILGFVANIYKTNMLVTLKEQYLFLMIYLLIILVLYLAMLILLSSGLSLKKWINHAKNLMPAGFLALTSGCSISTMPWTIAGADKNLQHPGFAKAVIPATTNIQQIGDCIVNSFLCVIIYNHFYGYIPPLDVWVYFSIIFVLARYATAAMIGGAIFVMLPIYQQYLSFNDEMIALILALNVILDPIVTSSNVIANGALCRVFERFFYCFKK